MALDVGLWFALRKPDRFGLKTRLAIDSVDVAVWSLAPYPAGLPYYYAVLIAFPLALEAGLRNRWRGLLVPAVILIATTATRLPFDRPVLPLLFLWLILAVGLGGLVRRYMGRLQRRSEAEWAHRRSAEHRRAFLGGQNAVAMGASSVVDAIEGLTPVVGQPEPGTALWAFANGWKPELCESTRGHAVYLGHALGEWSAAHNRHPDLASLVELNLSEGVGTTLLSGRQGAELCRHLSGLGLRGAWSVEVSEAVSQHPPGSALELRVGRHVVALQADSKRPPRTFDPSPTAFGLAASVMVADIMGFPLKLSGVVPFMAFSLAAAVWAHQRLRRFGAKSRPRILVVAVMLAIFYTAAATNSLLRPVNAAGVEQYPVGVGLGLLALLGGMYWHDLAVAMRCIVLTGAAVVVALAWIVHPAGRHPAHLIIVIGWSVPVLLCALRLAREFLSGSERYVRTLVDRDTEEQIAAFEDGRAAVTGLVRQACDEAHQRLAVVAARLPPQLAGNVRERLEEVDRRLDRMMDLSASSSSTTTN